MEILETSKGKPLGLYRGYQFRQYRCTNDVVTWLCLNEKTMKCKGRMAVRNGDILKFKEHTCKPDEARCEIKKHMFIARKRVREELLPIAQIYKEEVEKLFSKGRDIVADIPLYSSVKSSLYRIRRDSQRLMLGAQLLRVTATPAFLFDAVDEKLIIFTSGKGRGARECE